MYRTSTLQTARNAHEMLSHRNGGVQATPSGKAMQRIAIGVQSIDCQAVE